MEKKIFISHSTQDKDIVNSFMENVLIGALGINYDNIFNTSGCGTGIESGEDWRQSIRKNLESSDLIIEFISLSYKQSEICQNEFGAAEFMNKKVIPIIIPPLDFNNAGVLAGVKQLTMVNSDDGLDEIKDNIVNIVGLDASKLKTQRWNSKKKLFLNDVEYILHKKGSMVANSSDKRLDLLNLIYKRILKIED
ncbi:toll/interleukin-1 receptor domain-containing protein [Clostridium butyricum]